MNFVCPCPGSSVTLAQVHTMRETLRRTTPLQSSPCVTPLSILLQILGLLQVLISGHVLMRQAPNPLSNESLGRLLSLRVPDQGSVPLPRLVPAATLDQDMLTGKLAPEPGSELAPQPAKKVLTQQGHSLPVISAGMLRQQFRHLQALQKQQQGARSGSTPLLAPDPAAMAGHAPHQQLASGLALREAGPLALLQQPPNSLPRWSTPEMQQLPLAQAAASFGEVRCGKSPSRMLISVCREEASRQPGSERLHNLTHSVGCPDTQCCAQGAQATAAQAQAVSAVCSDKHQGRLSALLPAAPSHDERLHQAWPVCARLCPRACGDKVAYPAEQLPRGTCRPVSGPDVRFDSSATARSMPCHPGPDRAHGSALAGSSCTAVHGEWPGHAPLHVSAQPSLKAPVCGRGDRRGDFQVIADAAVTLQLVPAQKPAAECSNPRGKPQV